jgi:tetratricopeptide (TPR) repeat protein
LSAQRAFLVAGLAAMTALGLAHPATAQFLGDRTEARDCASAVGGNVTNSTVNVVCGIPHEQVHEFMRLAVSGRPADYTELLQRLDALIPATSRLRAEALARFFAILGEADVSPERLTDRLVTIAEHYQMLLAQLDAPGSSDPHVQRLNEQAREALQAGDFARTEELLNQAKSRDLSAIEQMRAAMEQMPAKLEARQLSAAENAAKNGTLMMTRLRYREAGGYFAEAVDLLPEGSDELRADYLNQQGTATWHGGDYRTAVQAHRAALDIRERIHAPDDPKLAYGLDNLALLYRAQGRYAEAEPLYQRSLAISEKALGPEHPEVATSLNNRAALYQAQGRYAEAELHHQRALAIRDKALGPEHLDVAQSLNNLAELYRALGRHAEAEPLSQRALAIWERVFGPQHPRVATGLDNLGALYRAQGRYAEAELLLRRALAIFKASLGDDHPRTQAVQRNLENLVGGGQTLQMIVVQIDPNSQAAQIGLQPDDVIESYGGEKIVQLPSLVAAVRRPGDSPRELIILRNGQILRFQVAPGPLGVKVQEAAANVGAAAETPRAPSVQERR